MHVYLKVNFQKYIVPEIIFLVYKWLSLFILTQVYKESIHSVNVKYSVNRPGILYKLKAIDMIWIKRDRYTLLWHTFYQYILSILNNYVNGTA